MNKFFAALPLIVIFSLMALATFAGPLPPTPSEDAPIDGFALVLVGAGVLYGGYQTRKKDKA